jgi:hypothetical protein
MNGAGGIQQVGPVVSVVISLVAVAFTVLSYRDRREQDRRDLFLKLHEKLIDADLQRGRRLIFTRAATVEDVEWLRDHEPEQYDLVNRAVAMFDVAGMYVAKNDFMAEWGPSYGRLWLASQSFLTVRFGDIPSGGVRGWPHFRTLGTEAAEALDPDPAPLPSE